MKRRRASPEEIDTRLRLLQAEVEEDRVVGELLCEFIDRRNRGEFVTSEEILAKAPYPEVKNKLTEVIAFADILLGPFEDGEDI
ncbi:MAG: hypothetical protein Q8Q95_00865 [bacterium]|nr:hypothetical protein [bacterium]